MHPAGIFTGRTRSLDTCCPANGDVLGGNLAPAVNTGHFFGVQVGNRGFVDEQFFGKLLRFHGLFFF
jgi:hypothetical protein